jgi:hypothetical protein
LIQVPSVAAILFNKAGAVMVDVSVNTLCGVFSGRLTQWDQIPSLGCTGYLPVVYPAQSSGTTGLFTRFLNAKCNEGGCFFVTTNCAASYTGGLPVGLWEPLPAKGDDERHEFRRWLYHVHEPGLCRIYIGGPG